MKTMNRTKFCPILMLFTIYANGDNMGGIHSTANNVLGWTDVTATANDYNDKTRTINIQEQDSKYRMKDTRRNIETYRTTYGGTLWTQPQLPGKLVESSSILWGPQKFDKIDVSAHANLEAVYDFYNNNLGWRSYDGNGARIIASTEYDDFNCIFSGDYKNAFWSPSRQQFVFGDEGHYAAALDVVAHEFTHAVINYIVGGSDPNTTLTYQGESGALNESYADIMGCIIEGKTGNGRWLLSEDADAAIRSMSNPAQFGDPSHYDNRYTGTGDNGGVHTNSNIFNHAAYLMMTDSRTSAISSNTWASLFINSLYRLTTDATFLNARGAIINTAKKLGFNHDQQEAIKKAFDSVGIKENDSIRIVLSWGANPKDLDSHLVGPGINGNPRFHVYYMQRSYDQNGNYDTTNSLYVADLDYDDTTSYGPEVTTIHIKTPGTYYFYVHDYSNGYSTTMIKKMRFLVMCTCITLLIVSLIKVVSYYVDYFAQQKASQSLRSTYYESFPVEDELRLGATNKSETMLETIPMINSSTLNPHPYYPKEYKQSVPPIISSTDEPVSNILPLISYPHNTQLIKQTQFVKLQRQNKDIVGWLTINGFIDQPIVQRDNKYYLNRDYLGYHNVNGALFLDENCQLSNWPYTYIIYGHNMKNGSMFGDLRRYENISFFRNNCIINFNTEYENGDYIVFSVCRIESERGFRKYVNIRGLSSCTISERKESINNSTFP